MVTRNKTRVVEYLATIQVVAALYCMSGTKNSHPEQNTGTKYGHPEQNSGTKMCHPEQTSGTKMCHPEQTSGTKNGHSELFYIYSTNQIRAGLNWTNRKFVVVRREGIRREDTVNLENTPVTFGSCSISLNLYKLFLTWNFLKTVLI